MPTLRRDSKGSILPTVENVQKSLASPAMVDWLIGYDAFRDELMWTPRGAVEWRSFTDPDYFRLRITLEQRGFKPVSKDIMRDAVAHAGDENKFDSAVTWLNGLPAHDGVARVETFLTRYFGVDDTPYTRAVSLYLWSAMAGRVLQPGVKADMVPILVGPQGIGKSSGIAAMVPSIEHFVEVSLGEKDDNLARTMRGKLVGEIAELRGLQTRDLETVKAFVTRTHEQWVPKFKEFAQLFPRRLVFIGTTNQNEFLADETGNRRWLPVNATFADRDAITADQLQLWAEARLKFIANGVMWSEAQALAGDAHAEHTVTDTWAESVEHWLNEPEFEGEIQRRATPIRTHDVLVGALNFVARDIQRVHENRVGRLMVALGFEKRVRRVDGRNTKVWVEIAENDLW
jgi:predicted P-loop ATPase